MPPSFLTLPREVRDNILLLVISAHRPVPVLPAYDASTSAPPTELSVVSEIKVQSHALLDCRRILNDINYQGRDKGEGVFYESSCNDGGSHIPVTASSSLLLTNR